MSAPQYRIPAKVRALWRERDVSMVSLAAVARVPLGRAMHAFAGHPSAQAADRRALAPLLTMAEHVALGWTQRGELLPVEHSEACSTNSTLNPQLSTIR